MEPSLIALRRARAERAAASMQRASLEAGTDRLTLDEIQAEVDAVRKSRRRSARRGSESVERVEIDAKEVDSHDS